MPMKEKYGDFFLLFDLFISFIFLFFLIETTLSPIII